MKLLHSVQSFGATTDQLCVRRLPAPVRRPLEQRHRHGPSATFGLGIVGKTGSTERIDARVRVGVADSPKQVELPVGAFRRSFLPQKPPGPSAVRQDLDRPPSSAPWRLSAGRRCRPDARGRGESRWHTGSVLPPARVPLQRCRPSRTPRPQADDDRRSAGPQEHRAPRSPERALGRESASSPRAGSLHLRSRRVRHRGRARARQNPRTQACRPTSPSARRVQVLRGRRARPAPMRLCEPSTSTPVK